MADDNKKQVQKNIDHSGNGKIDQWSVDTRDKLPGNGDMVREFRLQTPWTYNVSLGYTIGTSLALGAEYEYQDYST